MCKDFGPLTAWEMEGLDLLTDEFIPYSELKKQVDCFTVFDGLVQYGLADMVICTLIDGKQQRGCIHYFKRGNGQVIMQKKQLEELYDVGNQEA